MTEKQTLVGTGIGLRAQHYSDLLDSATNPVPWLEILADNFMVNGGLMMANLERIRARYPLSLHCVGMSLGSTDPLNMDYMQRLKELVNRIQPAQISDHLAWVGISGCYVHELIPMPYTEESLAHMTARIDQVQNLLGRRILIENPSAYLSYGASDIAEPEFLQQLCRIAGCGILLDVNNIHVSAVNNDFSSVDYLTAIPEDLVEEIHLAGYEEMEGYLFDTHGRCVHPPVWDLYQKAVSHLGQVPTLIEWDTEIPQFEVLLDEVNKAQAVLDIFGEAACRS